jgi:hypothetical protein
MEIIGRMRNKKYEGKKKNGDGGGRRCSDSPPIFCCICHCISVYGKGVMVSPLDKKNG